MIKGTVGVQENIEITDNAQGNSRNNFSKTTIDTATKTELQDFANIKDSKNQPIKNVTFVAPQVSPTQTTPQSCKIGDFTGTLAGNDCEYTNKDIIPGTQLTANLTGDFEMEFTINTIPQTNKYLLYAGNNFKLFFNAVSGKQTEICYKKGTSSANTLCTSIGSDKKIVFKRDSNNKIYLNDSDTGFSSSVKVGVMNIGFARQGITLLYMDNNNLINLKIKK